MSNADPFFPLSPLVLNFRCKTFPKLSYLLLSPLLRLCRSVCECVSLSSFFGGLKTFDLLCSRFFTPCSRIGLYPVQALFLCHFGAKFFLPFLCVTSPFCYSYYPLIVFCMLFCLDAVYISCRRRHGRAGGFCNIPNPMRVYFVTRLYRCVMHISKCSPFFT